MSYDYQPPKKPLTGNGEPWGTNAGHVGQGLLYGWALKRAIEAEQRRPEVVGEDPWTPAKYTAKVFVINCIHVWVWIVHSIYMLVALAWPFMDIDSGASVRSSILLLIFVSLPTVVFIRLAQAALGDAKRIYEGLPPKKEKRRFVPQGGMLLLAIAPMFYLIPLIAISSALHGGGVRG